MQNSPRSSTPSRAEPLLDRGPAQAPGTGVRRPSHQSSCSGPRGRYLAQPAGGLREREQHLEPVGRHPRLVLEGRIGGDVRVALEQAHEERRAAAAGAGEHHRLAARLEARAQGRAAPADRRHAARVHRRPARLDDGSSKSRAAGPATRSSRRSAPRPPPLHSGDQRHGQRDAGQDSPAGAQLDRASPVRRARPTRPRTSSVYVLSFVSPTAGRSIA